MTTRVQLLMRVTVPDGTDPQDFVEGLAHSVEKVTGHHVEYNAATAPQGRALARKGGSHPHSTPSPCA